MKHFISMLLILVITIVQSPSLASASDGKRASVENKKTMKQKYQELIRDIDGLPSLPDIDVLTQMGTVIDSLPLTQEEQSDWRDRRRMKLELWLKAIEKLDKIIDPTFNPDDVPQINVAPPLDSGLSAGASPSAIKDPKLRQEYEEAIRLNTEKASCYRLQKGVRKLDKDWTSKAKAFLKNQYTFQAQDVDEVNTLIDKLLSSTPRREQMKSILLSTK